MTSNMVMILAGILERLRYSFPESNSKSKHTARVHDILHPVRERLRQFIEKADANPDLAKVLAEKYGTEIMRLAHSFEDAMDLYVLKLKSRKRNGTSNEIQNYRVNEKLLRDAGNKLNQACSFSIASLIDLAKEISSGSAAQLYSYESDMVGMFDAEEELVSALIGGERHLRLVSICGMPGIGKTTLALKLYESPTTEHHFHLRAWISVSRIVDRREVLLKIHYGVNSDAEDDDSLLPEFALVERIRAYLKTENYLVVLDDVPDADAWFCLRNCFPDNGSGSRILITTQRKDAAVLNYGLETYIHTMRTLTDEESSDLLKTELKEEEIEKFGNHIKSASGGMPLAIVTLASSVKQNPSKKWEWHLENLYKGSPNSPLFNVLDKCYKSLPIQLRACLLYLANYFTDLPDTETDTFCQLLIAEGLVLVEDGKNNIGETMMDVAALCLDELDNRNLIQILEQEDGSDDAVSGERILRLFKSCKIHNVISGFCKSKENKHGFVEAIDLKDENQGLNLNPNLNLNTISSITSRIGIFLHENECSYDDDVVNNNIRSLLIFNHSVPIAPGYVRPREIPDLENFIRLRVLYLHAVDLKDGKFPEGIENLVHLRYLSFRECYLVELCSSSIITNLFYLQTLDLRVRNEGQVVTIPDQNVFNCLKRLRYLYLPPAYQVFPNGGKLKMEGVNELELLDNFDTSQCNVEDLLKMRNLMWVTMAATAQEHIVYEIKTILEFIKKNSGILRSMSLNLRDCDCYSVERLAMLERVFNSVSLQTLKINGHINDLPIFAASGITIPNSELTKIVLTASELSDDPMKILQVLPNLKILVLETEAYNGAGMNCSRFGFPELRYLKLSKLYKLTDWQVERDAMPKLRTLIIEGCQKLRMLPEGLRFLSSLRALEILSMSDEFVGRIVHKSDETKGADFYKIKHVLPNVKINGQILTLKEKPEGLTQNGKKSVEDAKIVINGQITGDPYYGNWNEDYLS